MSAGTTRQTASGADVYSSARIGAAAALTLVLVVILVLDVAVPDDDISPRILLPALGAICPLVGLEASAQVDVVDPCVRWTEVPCARSSRYGSPHARAARRRILTASRTRSRSAGGWMTVGSGLAAVARGVS
jgi:hypothetical protein